MGSRKKITAAKELKKIKAICATFPEDVAKITEGLVQDACFQAEQLALLRDKIEEVGWGETYQNGANQMGRKSTVEADAYIKLQKSYAALIKQLTDLMPKTEVNTAGQEILRYLGGGK